MPDSSCEPLTDKGVARLEKRRRSLSLTKAELLVRFEKALSRRCGRPSAAAVRMRLDRVLLKKMRRPISETTKMALGEALGWTLPQMEKALRGK